MINHNHPTYLHVHDLSVCYGSIVALANISFALNQSESIAVIGPNGAGKSTLFNVLAGLLQPANGTVTLTDFEAQNRIAYVPQRNQVDWQFPANVADVVMMGRARKIGLLRRANKLDKAKVYDALTQVGLQDLASRQIGELSGGQQQRVFIARALAQEATLLLLDEPLRGLDIQAQETILTILDALQQQNVTVMVATHNLNLAATRFDRLMLLNQRLIEYGQPDDVFKADLLAQAYGGQMQHIETAQGTIVINEAHTIRKPVASHG